MNRLVLGALRRPYTVIVASIAIVFGAWLSVRRAPADIFPTLAVPVVYVLQPYAGMTPSQMESQFIYYYEYHFLYVAGVEHVESQSMQGLGVVKLYFHPGTDIAQALAQVTAMAFRATSFMPPGTLPPFIVRFDAGSIPIGQLVFASATRSESEVQDAALNRVRPLLATLPGVSAPPPSGGKVRTIVVYLDPDRMRSRRLSPDDVAAAIGRSDAMLPAGNIRIGDQTTMVETNAMIRAPKELESVPIRTGAGPTVFVRDVARIEDGADIVYNVALVDGRRAVYMPVTKRADASTLDVVNAVKAALPAMRKQLPDGVELRFAFDQSPYVTSAISSLVEEGALGAILTALMVLVFLRNWRSATIVTITIPLSVLAAFIALRAAGQTVNIMTLGGLALSVGILVDEGTVTIENIHAHLARGQPAARAVLDAMREVMAPKLLATLCVVAVFIPAFFMTGIGASLFPPLALAVGFAMVASFLISNTLVPVLSVWMLGGRPDTHEAPAWFERFRRWYAPVAAWSVAHARRVTAAYVVVAVLAVVPAIWLGSELFPRVDAGQLRVRVRAPAGTSLERTTAIVQAVEGEIRTEVGDNFVETSVANIGNPAWNYPINGIYQSNTGPQDAELLVALRGGARASVFELEERLRARFASSHPDVRFSFEAADIVSRVLNFGAPTPIQVAVSGRDLTQSRRYAESVAARLREIPNLRDVQLPLALDYPVTRVDVDRERAGQHGLSGQDVSRAVLAATASTVLTTPLFWVDPKSGTPYRVALRVPESSLRSNAELLDLPVGRGDDPTLLSDVASVYSTSAPGAIDRINSQRAVTVTANLAGSDLGGAGRAVARALASLPTPPAGATVSVRGQVEQMSETLSSLAGGLVLAVIVVLLLLTASFQSVRAPLAVIAATPAVLGGVVLILLATRTTINVQSMMGAVMCIGVSVANAVLLVTFARERQAAGDSAAEAAVAAAVSRLRPILMTSGAMIAGMLPMALAIGGGGAQSAPLGRAVIGGLFAATIATLFCIPAVYTLLAGTSGALPTSLAPEDVTP
jgi:multidrug efflux pump subunit AcrB